MKYNQPYGVVDTNAAYVNGDPSVGRAGSIPPAESIEYPQREIVNLIADSGVTPSNTDLHQMARALQAGQIYYGIDAGTVNNVQITLAPAPLSLRDGMFIHVKMAHQNTQATTINVNALGAVPIVKSGGLPLQGFEWSTGDIIPLRYNGAAFQMIAGIPGQITYLQASQDYYVNFATGSDTLYDGRSATVSGTTGPFQTIQAAVNANTKFNQNGFNTTIHIADSPSYTGPVTLQPVNGSGAVIIQGNTSTPSAVTITSSTGSVFHTNGAGSFIVNGVKTVCTGTLGGDPGNGITASLGGSLTINAVEFGACVGAHLSASGGGRMTVNGPVIISGGAKYHFWATVSAEIDLNTQAPPSLNITGAVTFSNAFAEADNLGVLYGHYGTITGGSNVTGKRYDATLNGIVNTLAGTAYPGTIAGTTEFGGQFN